ncbi:MAG TPA: VacJ family lipoprotein [Candidatus Sulfotelmatobacter sp.]|nr:VacJ family lipoprotein [Candidatus Sulfotelmatobacter sp.]
MSTEARARGAFGGAALLLAVAMALGACSTPGGGAGGAADGLPGDVAAAVDRAAAESNRQAADDAALYGDLGNPELAATEQRIARAQAERSLTAAVVAEVARHPDLSDAIVARAGTDAPQSAANIAAAVHAAYPALGGNAAAGADNTIPTTWYEEQPRVHAGPLAATGTEYAIQAAPSAQVPRNWYQQPALDRIAGAPPFPQPPLPAGVTPAPARLVVPPPTPEGRVATVPPESNVKSESAAADPFEPVNRAFFALNQVADTFILRPIAWTYSFAPDFVKIAVRRAIDNMDEPVVAANDLLQARPNRAGSALSRFVINSTIGVAGFYDAADPLFGLKPHKSDFGQTLHSYGVEAGPYIMLPLFGPSDARDAIGRAVDLAMDPFTYLLNRNLMLGRAGITAIAKREELLKPLDDLRAGSVDYYVSLRSSYLQNRAAELNGSTLGAAPAAAPAADKATDELFNQAK